MKKIIEEPSIDKWCAVTSHSPGLLIELTSDKSLIELSHFYYGKQGDMETTQIVGIRTKQLDTVINFLNEIKSKLIHKGKSV